MTLSTFDSDSLDALALRFLDLAAAVRNMAVTAREHDLRNVPLHINKVNEWLGHLDNWCHDGTAKIEAQLLKQRGAMRAQVLQATILPPTKRGRGRKR